jgi:Bifunctional DNA primase/polymerase, N-terminal/Primase C terminal 2 (PriCT-2)/Family of unknown function (DUF5906)
MFQEYVKAGWALCIIPRGTKGPMYPKWNERIVDEETASVIEGAGILHVESGTCALDIDDLGAARLWLAERGVDVDALLAAKDAVKISSGRFGRAKLLYRLKTPLRTIKPEGAGVELRCATAAGKSVQDVLPPTIHKDTGKPYEWLYGEPLLGDWAALPPIPATLKAAWKALIDESPAPRSNGHDHLNGSMDIALEKLHAWIAKLDPNAPYDEWLKVGMKLHHATGGAEEGLAIWDGWSAKATRRDKLGRPVYGGQATCRVHWVSFQSTPGKIVATLDNEMPADASEFDTIAPEPATDPAADAQARATAKQQKIDAFAKLEARVVYVLASEKYFDTARHQLIGSDSALEHQFTWMMPRQKGARINPVKVLKQSTTKKIIDGLGFHPGEGALFKVGTDTYANTYRDRLPKPIMPTKLELEKIEWIFARIDDERYRQWLKQYFAHVVQKPSVKIKTAPLIWSETQRSGKSTLLKTIPALLVGAEFSADVDYSLLNSDFNDYLQGAWHVNLMEFRAGTRGERAMINSKLKAYIAEDMIPIHPKGGRAYTMPNHFFVTATSNEEDAAAIDGNDERWGVHELKAPRYTQAEDQWIYHEFLNLRARAAAVLRHYFLHISLDGFSATASPPMTEAKRDMAEASTPSDVEMLVTLFEERAEFFVRDVVLMSDVVSYIQRTLRFTSPTRVGRILAKPPFNGRAKKLRVGESCYRVVIVRNHNKWDMTPHHETLNYIRGDNDDIDILA